MRVRNKQVRGQCLEFTLQVLIIANSMPPMRRQIKQVNNLDLAIQSQEYSKNRANGRHDKWHESCTYKSCAKAQPSRGGGVGRGMELHEKGNMPEYIFPTL